MSGSGATKLVSGSIAVENQTALVLTLPGYYQGNEPGVNDYAQPLPVVAANDQVGYGTTNGLAPGVTVIFEKSTSRVKGASALFARRRRRISSSCAMRRISISR